MRWADYAITAVRYSEDRAHITDLEVRVDQDSTLGGPDELTREAVVRMIEQGYTFVTAYVRNGQWSRGAEVSVVPIGRDKYLRTDRNQVRADNLGELPELAARPAASWR